MTTVELSVAQLFMVLTAGVVGYLFVLRRLADMAQPLRLELANAGERLLASGISHARKNQVSFCLGNAFSGYVMLIAVLVFPVAVLGKMFSKRAALDTVHQSFDEKKLTVLFGVSAFVANPIFGTILAVEFFLLGLVLFIAHGPAAVAAAVMQTLRAEGSMPFLKARSA
jgi:hypothetical protein